MAALAPQDGALIPGAAQRIDRSMDVAIDRESRELNRGLTFLASVGSASPFIGLFGTVWGIKHAFEEIALQQSTNLAVVAPGIAEALLATGLGLLAAIPATIFYNKLSDDSDEITSGMSSSPTSSAPSCRATWTAEDGRAAAQAAGRQRAAAAALEGRGAHVRDQRHALRGRDAGAADHLHGGGADADGGRADRVAAHRGGRAAGEQEEPLTSR
jgi:hypothetical protein